MPKFSSVKKEAYFQALRDGARRGAAALAAGVGIHTVRNHRAKDMEFRAAEDQAELDACEIIEDALFQAASSGNVPSMIFFLCNRMPERWLNTQTQKHEHSGPGGGPVPTEDYTDLTPEERKARIDELLARRGT